MSLLKSTLTTGSSYLGTNLIYDGDNDAETLLGTTLTGLATELSLGGGPTAIVMQSQQLQNAEMIVQSMSVEELQELRDLLVEKQVEFEEKETPKQFIL